jgi:hypothetical protein
MADPRLDNLLKQCAEHEALGDPGKDCPAVSVLWLHATEDQPLGDHDAHVQDCARCRKRLELIHCELQLETVPTASRPTVFRLPMIAGALAAAACLTLLVLNWQLESTDSGGFYGRVARYLDDAGSAARPILRGPNDAPTTTPGDTDVWVQALRDDKQAEQALSDRDYYEKILLQQREKGRIVVIDGRPTIAPDAVMKPAKRETLTRQLEDDDDACERIVDALIRHLPDATENDRAELRRALDCWRAKRVFGGDP